jgi:hypothetical protein
MKNTKPKSTKPTKPTNDEVTIEDCLLAITSTLNNITVETFELRDSTEYIAGSIRLWQGTTLAFAVLSVINTIWLFLK